MNKLISFSLFGNNPVYYWGILENVRLQPEVYPGWRCRVYVSQEIPAALVTQMSAMGAEIIRKVRTTRLDGTFWRFLPAAEPEIDVLIVRDADSRLSQRESLAVAEWLQSDKSVHIMRDHPQHIGPMLGGMWGCRGPVLQELLCLLAQWQQQNAQLWQQSRYGIDELFLNQIIYPYVRRSAYVHSELIRYDGEEAHPFPGLKTKGRFVGKPIVAPFDSAMLFIILTFLFKKTPLANQFLSYYLRLKCAGRGAKG